MELPEANNPEIPKIEIGGGFSNDFDDNSEKTETSETKNVDKPWNYKIILLLQKIGKKTMGYRWMHEQDTKYYEKMNTKFNIYERLILAFMGTITGAGFVNFIVDAGLSANRVIYIVITILQIITVFFAAIIKEYRHVNNYDKHKDDHSSAALKNAEINLDIQYQLALNIKDREEDRHFLSDTIKKFNDVLYLAPAIREETKKKYLAESEDNDMFNTIMSNQDGAIEVVVHNNDKINDKRNNVDEAKVNYQIDRWLKHF